MVFRYDSYRPLVYVDEAVSLFLDGTEHVDLYQEEMSKIAAAALDRGESREMLAALASEFDRPEVSPDAPEHLAEEQSQQRP